MRRATLAIAALLALALLAAPAAAFAAAPIPVAEYAARVSAARDLVETGLGHIGEQPVAHDVATHLRELFPQDESVTLGTQTIPAENGTLRSLIERLDAASTAEQRTQVAAELLSNLRSTEAALGTPGTAPVGDAAVLKRILADEGVTKTDDARKKLTEAFQELIDGMLRWLENATGSPTAQTSFRLIYYALLVASGLLVAWLAYVVIRRMRATIARAAGEDDAGSGDAVIAAAEGLPDDILAFADTEAAAGRYREAVRALFGGAARELVERGVVARTRTRTDGELLADVAIARPAVLPALTALCSAFEPAWYGHIDPGADGYASAREIYLGFMAAPGGDAA